MPTENAARMLIADDDPNLLDAYVLFFSAQGYDIQTAGDGVEALDAYRAWRPGVVVLDIQRCPLWTDARWQERFGACNPHLSRYW